MAKESKKERRQKRADKKAENLEKDRSKIDSLFEPSVREEGGKFNISFEYFDDSQEHGSSFSDWEEIGLLSRTLNVLKDFCGRSLVSQLRTDKFHSIGAFPSPDKTKFTKPVNVPLDANWAVLHVGGAEVLAGHIYEDTFFIVFFDPTHSFFLTRKVREN